MSEIVRVGKKYVVVIPKSVRKRVGLKEGDLLNVKVEGERIILERRKLDPFDILAKVVREPYEEEKDEKMAEEWLKKRGG